ncbi:hypothetical protein MCBMB27_05618 [Methylobacterium phyllosphaerae]|uniref:HB1, ASXL, restriction endonuclease HTH domain n=1 Tax=Methylobacterium phyllosphaerae TaxID=418223 RepID=A0AAE8L8B6_9HYPH|nr:hypothetical protein MCBMB27_05618 [Methylobacterium phyllosphaerae]SFH36412.1 HB1, ASXL, restriction endonuclease HTH domain [Methylobacterium phyllosphaerae]
MPSRHTVADAYLNIAERIFQVVRRPMRPREIIIEAYAAGLLPPHLHGSRQDKTLHARLSEDISSNPDDSRFFRTAPGVFFLEEFRLDPTIPLISRDKFLAPRRRKELKRDSVLIVDLDFTSDLRPDKQTLSVSRLLDVLRAGRYSYRSVDYAMRSESSIVVHSFVVVHQNGMVLSFRCGKYFPSTDPLYGTRSIGVGGAIFPDDNDMLYHSMYGIIGNGINELRYGIGLPNRLAEVARYTNQVRPYIGVLVPDAIPKVVHVVMGYQCPDDFLPSKSALSINDLRWVDAINPTNNISDYDATSRILFQQDHVRELIRAGAPK